MNAKFHFLKARHAFIKMTMEPLLHIRLTRSMAIQVILNSNIYTDRKSEEILNSIDM